MAKYDRNWLINQPPEVLQLHVRSSTVPMLWSGSDGEIYWCNAAFEDWSGYTLSELQELGWQKISVNDDQLEADTKAVAEVVDGFRTHYTITKQYVPKGDKAQWGELTVVPCFSPTDHKQLLFFQCTWLPLKNGTAISYSIAIEAIKSMHHSLAELKSDLDKVHATTMPQRVALSLVELIVTYPKACGVVGLGFLLMIGGNQMFTIIQNLRQLYFGQLLEPPPAVQPHLAPPATKIAHMTARDPEADMILTGSGLKIEWHREQGATPLWPTTHYQ